MEGYPFTKEHSRMLHSFPLQLLNTVYSTDTSQDTLQQPTTLTETAQDGETVPSKVTFVTDFKVAVNVGQHFLVIIFYSGVNLASLMQLIYLAVVLLCDAICRLSGPELTFQSYTCLSG